MCGLQHNAEYLRTKAYLQYMGRQKLSKPRVSLTPKPLFSSRRMSRRAILYENESQQLSESEQPKALANDKEILVSESLIRKKSLPYLNNANSDDFIIGNFTVNIETIKKGKTIRKLKTFEHKKEFKDLKAIFGEEEEEDNLSSGLGPRGRLRPLGRNKPTEVEQDVPSLSSSAESSSSFLPSSKHDPPPPPNIVEVASHLSQKSIFEGNNELNRILDQIKTLRQAISRDYDSDRLVKITQVIMNHLSKKKHRIVGKLTQQSSVFTSNGELPNDDLNKTFVTPEGQFKDFKDLRKSLNSREGEGFSKSISNKTNSDARRLSPTKIRDKDGKFTKPQDLSLESFKKPETKGELKRKMDEVTDAKSSKWVKKSIINSYKRMWYRKYEYSMLLWIFLIIVFKVVLKAMYDNSLENLVNYQTRIDMIASILRPSAFFLQRCTIVLLDIRHFINKTQFPDQKLYYSEISNYFYADMKAQQSVLIETFSNKRSIVGFSSNGTHLRYNDELYYNRSLATIYSLYSVLTAELWIIMTNPLKIRWTIETFDPLMVDCQMASLAMFDNLIRMYLSEEFSGKDYLGYSRTLFLIYYGSNLIVTILVGLSLFIAGMSIRAQYKIVADLFGLLDREEIMMAISSLEERISQHTSEQAASVKHYSAEQRLAKFRKVVLDTRPADELIIKAESRLAQSALANRIRHNHLVIKGYPLKNIKTLLFSILVVSIAINIPSVPSFLIINDSHSSMVAAFDIASMINIGSASAIMLNGVAYLMYLNQFDKREKVLRGQQNYLIPTLKTELRKTQHLGSVGPLSQKDLENICGTLVNFEPLLQSAKLAKYCSFATNNLEHFDYILSINQLIGRLEYMEASLAQSTPPSITSFFSQPEFLRADLLSNFVSFAMHHYSRLSNNFIKTIIDSNMSTSTLLLIAYVLTWVLYIIFYYRYWLMQRLNVWRRLTHSMAIMNENILDNVYLKHYFRPHSSSSTM